MSASSIVRPCVAVAALAALAGCHDVVARPQPPLEGLSGALLVATRSTGVRGEASLLEARAFDPRLEGGGFALPSDADGMMLLGFSCPLERMGLTAGGVKFEAVAVDAPPRLPPPARALEVALDGDDASWAPLDVAAPVVAAVRARTPTPEGALCASTGARYVSESIALPDVDLGLPVALFPLDEARAIALVASASIPARTYGYVLSPDGRASRVTLRGAEDAVGGIVDDAGGLWLLRRDGHLARGRVDGDAGFEVVTSTTPFGDVSAALLTYADGGVYVSARRGDSGFRLARWTEAGGWRRYDVGGPDFPVASFARARDGLFAAPYDPALLRLTPSDAAPIDVPGNGGPVAQLEPHDTLGLIVTTVAGARVVVGRPGAWTSLPLPLRAYFARFVVAEGEGFVLGGAPTFEVRQSIFFQYQPSTGFCAGFERLTQGFASHALRTADGVFALSLPELDAPTSAVFLRRVVEATSCSAAP